MGICGVLQDYRDLWGFAGDFWGLWGSVGICENLSESAEDCGGLRGTAGIYLVHTLRHSETFLVGPAGFPVLYPLAMGKILSWTGQTTNYSPSSSYPQDGWTALLPTLSTSSLSTFSSFASLLFSCSFFTFSSLSDYSSSSSFPSYLFSFYLFSLSPSLPLRFLVF